MTEERKENCGSLTIAKYSLTAHEHEQHADNQICQLVNVLVCMYACVCIHTERKRYSIESVQYAHICESCWYCWRNEYMNRAFMYSTPMKCVCSRVISAQRPCKKPTTPFRTVSVHLQILYYEVIAKKVLKLNDRTKRAATKFYFISWKNVNHQQFVLVFNHFSVIMWVFKIQQFKINCTKRASLNTIKSIITTQNLQTSSINLQLNFNFRGKFPYSTFIDLKKNWSTMSMIRCCFEPIELPEFVDTMIQKCTGPSCK